MVNWEKQVQTVDEARSALVCHVLVFISSLCVISRPSSVFTCVLLVN